MRRRAARGLEESLRKSVVREKIKLATGSQAREKLGRDERDKKPCLERVEPWAIGIGIKIALRTEFGCSQHPFVEDDDARAACDPDTAWRRAVLAFWPVPGAISGACTHAM